MGEFDLIERFFTRPAQAGYTAAVAVGIGDDCAILQPSPGMQLAISSDMLVAGRHFFTDTDPARLGHKALAVNLSDLAACGAEPLGFTLALALETIEARWLQAFSGGMLALAGQHHCPLVGGDTTKGPMTINITVFGQLPQGQALLRSGARPGDDLYVSGTIGEARAGLALLRGEWTLADAALRQHLCQRLEAPTPRLALGQRLRGIASAAMDLSDGLRGDLGHILKASGVGAHIDGVAVLATSPALWQALAAWPAQRQIAFALAGGDDYELLFTAAPAERAAIAAIGAALAVPVQRIGRIVAGHGITVVDGDGQPVPLDLPSFDHFG
ncbi:thiamine-phosphate kinase [Corticibacter populi]|uniref:Thiamine-monophosphate kinase n=1 Tax=Corticibacter populi TaxID=1550736 RepID=A0A3M6QPK5_9BURK|nr:thiamine-phosphate kinase [Corticibacter populi]RMX04955.1 thiamine-phosphate kinase [Corticibacter populi]RZS33618.1 thiamine-phosphate kinase [Corticibacter populi]